MDILDLNNKSVQAKLGNRITSIARNFNIKLYQADLDYVCNVMWHNKSAAILIRGMNRNGLENNPNYANRAMIEPELLNYWQRIIVVSEQFYNDAHCPKGIRAVLFGLIGMYYNWIELIPGGKATLNMRRPYLERWIEMCR